MFNYAMVKKLYIKNIKEINNKLILIEKKKKKKKEKNLVCLLFTLSI